MSKPHCLTHTARFSRFSVKQTQVACSSFHQGEIRDTVKVTGSKPCSKQIDPYFRGREKKKNNPKLKLKYIQGLWLPKLTPSSSPLLTQCFKDAQLQVFQVSAQNMQLTLCIQEKRKVFPGWEAGLEDGIVTCKAWPSPTTCCLLDPQPPEKPSAQEGEAEPPPPNPQPLSDGVWLDMEA